VSVDCSRPFGLGWGSPVTDGQTNRQTEALIDIAGVRAVVPVQPFAPISLRLADGRAIPVIRSARGSDRGDRRDTVKIGDTIFDGSVRHQLQLLREKLVAVEA